MSSSDREGRVPVRMTSEEYPIIISFSTAAKMATTGQKWETVGKVNKKHKANGSAGSKAQKRLLKENMPTLEVSGKFANRVVSVAVNTFFPTWPRL